MATDQELLFALRRGESQALEAVIRAYSPYVTAVIEYQLGRNAARGDVEELSADVFFTLWQWRGRLQTDRLRGWLGATARNAARDFLRKRQLHTVAAEDYLTVSDESAQRAIGAGRAHRPSSRRRWKPWSRRPREVFLRYYYYNQPIREIALATGLSETAVKSRLLRGRKKLKEQLTARRLSL